MKSELILLSDVEIETIEGLRDKYDSLSIEALGAIEQLFRQTRILLTVVTERGSGRESQWVLMGIIYRTYELLLGGIQQITRGNKHVFGACFRGLLETFGAMVYVHKKPASLPALLQGEGIKVGKLVNVAYSELQGFKEDYEWMSSWVHPNPASLLLGLKPIDDERQLAIFAIPPRSVSPNEARVSIEALVDISTLIYERVETLVVSHPEIFNTGRLMADMVWKGGENIPGELDDANLTSDQGVS